ARQRRENIKGAFALADGADIAGKSILLIDDIYTTGVTVSEAMRPLKEAGASVMVFTYSREFRE
ncbi:MAG: phosphoribosyltransferase family protein, partial [Christensenella sp.]|uniref:ComF family protein n=1 Tax=Christensenella sp. TaxID=1935934 RepID=UPI002B20F667